MHTKRKKETNKKPLHTLINCDCQIWKPETPSVAEVKKCFRSLQLQYQSIPYTKNKTKTKQKFYTFKYVLNILVNSSSKNIDTDTDDL